jgi:hypothetical protein
MIAAIVHALGVYLGRHEELYEFTFEDQKMNRPDIAIRYTTIDERNAEHNIWGWKDPTAITGVANLLYTLRNPHVIIVFRDLLASIQGEMRVDSENNATPRPFSVLAQTTLEWLRANVDFIIRAKCPVLLLSYERSIRNPSDCLNAIISFLRITPSQQQIAEALSRINTSGGYYRLALP